MGQRFERWACHFSRCRQRTACLTRSPLAVGRWQSAVCRASRRHGARPPFGQDVAADLHGGHDRFRIDAARLPEPAHHALGGVRHRTPAISQRLAMPASGERRPDVNGEASAAGDDVAGIAGVLRDCRPRPRSTLGARHSGPSARAIQGPATPGSARPRNSAAVNFGRRCMNATSAHGSASGRRCRHAGMPVNLMPLRVIQSSSRRRPRAGQRLHAAADLGRRHAPAAMALRAFVEMARGAVERRWNDARCARPDRLTHGHFQQRVDRLGVLHARGNVVPAAPHEGRRTQRERQNQGSQGAARPTPATPMRVTSAHSKAR